MVAKTAYVSQGLRAFVTHADFLELLDTGSVFCSLQLAKGTLVPDAVLLSLTHSGRELLRELYTGYAASMEQARRELGVTRPRKTRDKRKASRG